LKIAVTGAAGFIGSHLGQALERAGHTVTRIVEGGTEVCAARSETVSADIVSGNNLLSALAGADGVVHLAARNHVLKETEKDPLAAYRRVNVDGTRNVIRAAARAGTKWFIHFSSAKAMGEGGEVVLDEDSACLPKTPYGISKLESEEVVRAEANGAGMVVAIFRLPMVYGPGNLGNLPRMIRWADRGLPFPLIQPDNLRSMVYVGNVVAAVLAVLESIRSGKTVQGTYIVKDEKDYSTRMIYSSICRELGKAPRFLPFPEVLGRIAGAVSEDFRKVTSSFRVSSAKIREELGFVPPYSGEEGIARTVRWYKSSVR